LYCPREAKSPQVSNEIATKWHLGQFGHGLCPLAFGFDGVCFGLRVWSVSHRISFSVCRELAHVLDVAQTAAAGVAAGPLRGPTCSAMPSVSIDVGIFLIEWMPAQTKHLR
jgi:hypothetical protein